MSKGIEWIKRNKSFLSIEGINKHLNTTIGLPNSTLRNGISGNQKIGKKWIKPVDEFVEKLKK